MNLARSTADCLIIFTRYPIPGETKTRLIPAVGAVGAANLHSQMTQHTVNQARKLRDTDPTSIEVHVAQERDDRDLTNWLGVDLFYQVQGNGDLGERMARSISLAIQAGSERVIIIGTDCPSVNPDLLKSAFQQLTDRDLILGPAIDGGYYLIGLRRFIPELFGGINWSTAAVFQQTVDIADRLGLSRGTLPALADIDRPEDLPIWEQIRTETSDLPILPPKISIIIPTLNEAKTIEQTIARIIANHNIEVIIVDGGSTDRTVEIAQKLGVKIVSASGGRAIQMNVGAAVATGKILLFLHADTLLPPGFAIMVRECLLPSNTHLGPIAGAFALRIDAPQWRLRLIEWGVNWRSRFCQMPYGDQAIFLTAETFDKIGGFPDLPIMEDFQLIRELSRLGRVEILSTPVLTSARRWLHRGIWQTTMINQLVIIGYLLGVPPIQLRQWYRDRSPLLYRDFFLALFSAKEKDI